MTVGIPDLPETTSPNLTDELLINNIGNPRRVKVERVLALTGLDATTVNSRITQNEVDISQLRTDLNQTIEGTVGFSVLNNLEGQLNSNKVQFSGLNADKLDGLDATEFATSDQGNRADTAVQPNDLSSIATSGNASDLNGIVALANLPTGAGNNFDADLLDGQQGSYYLNASNLNSGTLSLARLPSQVWRSDNDGPGSGLHADLLDGQQGSYYLNYNNFTNTPGASIEIDAGNALLGGGTFSVDSKTNKSIRIDHRTSSQSSVNNSGSTVIQDVILDAYGHITTLRSKTLNANDINAIPSSDASKFVLGNGSDNGRIVIETDNSEFILRDPSDLITNYFWKDPSDNTLKIGGDGDVKFRSDVDFSNQDLKNVRELDGTNVNYFAKTNQNQQIGPRWYFTRGISTSTQSANETNPAGNDVIGAAISQNGFISVHGNNASGRFGINGNGAINEFYSNGNLYGSISFNGSSIQFNSGSDYRLKEDIQDLSINDAVTAIKSYLPRTFIWKENQNADVGFIAHEFSEVTPQGVSGNKDEVDENGNPIYQGMQASNAKTIAEIVKVCQHLLKENENLKTRIETLENS